MNQVENGGNQTNETADICAAATCILARFFFFFYSILHLWGKS